jgi:pyruvate/2-oxoglutarate dehydrogenase complex dihydrolipoamide acyltransferase (E2) component
MVMVRIHRTTVISSPRVEQPWEEVPTVGDPRRATRLSWGRLQVLDVLRLAARQPTIHGLLEVDITGVRARLAAAEGSPTMTAFVVASLARAVRDCPEVNVRRAGRKVVWFDAVDVAVTVERLAADAILPIPFPVYSADRKSIVAITSELRAARTAPVERAEEVSGRSVLAVLPPVVRRIGAVAIGRFPRAAARFGPAIGVSSVGMFGAGWGIPLSPLTLMVTIGGPTSRAVVVDGRVENREYLPLTLSFDHSVIDGAPAARFASGFRNLLETAAAVPAETAE